MFSNKYEFTAVNIAYEIKRKCNNGIDVIVGISLGGLVAPHIAKKYQNAKLVFIASGPKLNSDSQFINLLFKLLRHGKILDTLRPLLVLPDKIIEFFYQLANPFNGVDEHKKEYLFDMQQNIKEIKNIPIYKEKEILDFAYQTDNFNLLSELDNKAIIFIGKKDVLMPKVGGEELHKLLINSRLVISEGEHFNTFTEANLKELNRFMLRS